MRILSFYPHITVYFEKENVPSERASGNSIFELIKLGANYGENIIFTLQGNNKEELDNLSKTLLELFDHFSFNEES